MQNDATKNPKLFISYCWSSPDHEQWVIDLATSLMESGVDVILDKWSLREGHDSIAFMEQMVTDKQIKKVAIISDRVYAEKADGRSGGVGTETQIISQVIYEKQKQEKFVAIIPERDDAGKPYLPTYFKGKIYIDLSESGKYAENFEKLLRWIFGKPLYVRPEIGNVPAFLAETAGPTMPTSVAYKRAAEAVKTGKSYYMGAVQEYLDVFLSSLSNFKILKKDGIEFDELVIDNIKSFSPYRNEYIALMHAISQYGKAGDIVIKIHKFFENLIPFMFRGRDVATWVEWDFDNFRYIIHELYLYTIAILLSFEDFDAVNYLIETPYYNRRPDVSAEQQVTTFRAFRQSTRVFNHRNDRLKLNRLSLNADMIKTGAEVSVIDFSQIMQADFILFMRSLVSNEGRWWPETLVYVGYFYNAFEIFARSSSEKYFNRMKVVLGVSDKGQLHAVLEKISANQLTPRWQFDSFEPAKLMGYENLCTRP